MAKNSTAGQPTDQPVEQRPGVTHREADWHGFSQPGPIGEGLDGSTAVGGAKGNRSAKDMPRPTPQAQRGLPRLEERAPWRR